MRGMKTRIRDSVNSMSEESCEERLQYLIATAERPGLRGCSDHAVQVLEKRAFQIGTRAGDGMAVGLLFQAVLWTWFLGCVITYRIGKHLLVEGEGFKSIEFSMLCLYTAGLIAFHCLQPTGKWILFAILVLWFIVQFMCHWYFTFSGASAQK